MQSSLIISNARILKNALFIVRVLAYGVVSYSERGLYTTTVCKQIL